MAKSNHKLNKLTNQHSSHQHNPTTHTHNDKNKPINKQRSGIPNTKLNKSHIFPQDYSNNQNHNQNQKPPKSQFNHQANLNQNHPSNQNPAKSSQVDERFAKASYDPKFLRPKKQITKVKIDSRFSKMFTDPAFQNFTKVDKYGRKISNPQATKNNPNKQLKEYYIKHGQDNSQQMDQENIDQDEDDVQRSQEDHQQIELDQSQEDRQNEDQQSQDEQQQDNAQSIRKWMLEYDEESSSLGDMPVEQLIQQQEKDIPEVWSDNDEHVVKNQTVKATKRLALCNYDWMNITSKDLMILFNSFKGPAGFIKSIKVYQSNFGKEKMEQQAIFGPQGIWNEQEEVDEFNDDLEKQKNLKTNQFNHNSSKWRKSWKELLKRQDSTLDSAKLRAYEKQRLKYFYAVIECDTKKTADEIYKQCDGNQFQNSNLSFDLRFIPDETSFDKNMLKEECNQMPIRGQVKNFINRAMGHSKVQLTWEDPELSLPASLKKKNWGKMTEEELDKIDWATYLNEQDVEEDENKQKLFLQKEEDQVIPEWKKQCNKKYRKQNKGESLVISFDSGFGPSKIIKKQQKKSEQEPVSLNKQKKSKKEMWVKAQEERNKRRQELALMTQGQDDQKEKSFKPNLQDERFKAVYENPIFSIDPSNPKFDHRKAGNVFKEVVKRNKQKGLN